MLSRFAHVFEVDVIAGTGATTMDHHRQCLIANAMVVVQCGALTNSLRDIWVQASILPLQPQYS